MQKELQYLSKLQCNVNGPTKCNNKMTVNNGKKNKSNQMDQKSTFFMGRLPEQWH